MLEKMGKTLTDSIRKAKGKAQVSIEAKEKSFQNTKSVINDTNKDLKTKNMLSTMCDAILKKNHDLYLKHEETMDEERLFRKQLADECQQKMTSINEDLNNQKQERVDKIEENNRLRTDINEAINGFKDKEGKYQTEMKEHQAKMEVVQAQIKGTLEERVVKTVKEVNEDKEKFEATCANVQSLSEQIKGFMEKFDQMKEEITESGKKFKSYQEEIESRKMKIELLEAQIENTHLVQKKQDRVATEIKEERERLKKQVETLKGLKDALTLKLSMQK